MSKPIHQDSNLPIELAAPARPALIAAGYTRLDQIARASEAEIAQVQTLLRLDLVDEYRLLVYPIVRGSGQRLFPAGSQATLKLTDTKSFSSGVVLLQYQPQAQGK